MQKFNSKREEFNYYVLKSEWCKKRGDVVNQKNFLKKAKQVKEEMNRQLKK